MNPFPSIPFVRLSIGFISGIILFNLYPGLSYVAWIIVGIMLFSFIIAPYSFTAQWNRSWIAGLVINITLVALGYLNAHYKRSPKSIGDIQNMKVHVAELEENPIEKQNSYKAKARLIYSQNEEERIHGNNGIILYFQKEESVRTLKHGQKIVFSAKVSLPNEPKNPRQFNYKEYLASQGVYYQAYIKNNAYQVIKEASHKGFFYYIKELRYEILDRLRRFDMNEEVTGIGAALLTGYKEELEPDTKASFSRVGAMHILAVSGLHVGIIYMMISGMLFFLNKGLYRRIIRLLITLLFLWIYVILTGMSPSVLRAGFMFSLISIGQTLNYKTSIYNTIFLSAFIILIADPGSIYHVGFQLSYLAVLGIVFLFPTMNNWITTRYWIINKIWGLTCVSLAAQIATTPISLYHFGQFPTSFLIANLLIVPLAGIIIYSGIAAVIFNGVPLLGSFTMGIFKFLITSMYQIILFIENIPYSYAENLTINAIQCILMYLGIICFVCFFMYRYATWLMAGLCVVILFLITMTYRNWQINQQEQLIIYALNKKSRLEIIHGREVYYPWFEELTPMEYGLFVKANHQWRGIRKHNRVENSEKNNLLYIQYPFIQAGNKRIWVVDDSLMLPANKIETNYVWIKSKRYFEPEKLSRLLQYERVLLDPCIPEKTRKKLIKALTQKNIKFYDIAQSGAFIVNLN